MSSSASTPLWLWQWSEPYTLLPWETRRADGEVLSTKVRARWERTREKRRDAMYAMVNELYADGDAGYRLRTNRVHASRVSLAAGRRRNSALPADKEEGGPTAWNYLTARVKRMWERGEITTDQMKASVSYAFWYRMQWVMHAPPTNMVKMEKVDGGRFSTHVRSGSVFPIHKLLAVERSVLEAALIYEVAFKDLPASIGHSRITRHRTGRAAFLSALSAFDRLIKTVLTR